VRLQPRTGTTAFGNRWHFRNRDRIGDFAAALFSRSAKGKRIFLMSPLHHHFELKGWARTVVVRFWIIVGLCVLGGIGLLIADGFENAIP
jgi:hypothetical protein